MAANSQDFLTKVGSPGTATTLAAPGHTIGGTSFTVVSTTNWPTDTGVIFAVDTFTMQTVNGVATAVRNPGSYTEWEAVVSSSTSLTSAVLRYGTDQNYSAGANTRVYIPVSSSRENRLVDGLLAAGITLSGGMGAIAPTSITTSGNVTIGGSLTIGSAGTNGWSPITGSITSVTANGNRSYTCATSADNSAFISPGMRLRTTRTVAAPTQCTNLNGTTQYWSKTTPAGMTFTNNFTCGAWIKLFSYAAGDMGIESRFTAASGGWIFNLASTGQLVLQAFNTSNANVAKITSYQSIPLNKWVHVAAVLDMTDLTVSTTQSSLYIDGVLVPGTGSRTGTNPTTLTQAGNLEIGSYGGGSSFFPGKIAQPFIASTKITQANIQSLYSQGLTSALITANNIISAYDFNGNANDLNTTNANNLTANGSAVATNADSPFGGQADGTISSTLDYAIVQKVTSTTLTVQVPEGCTIPTSGGITSASYSTYKVPYGFPGQRDKWRIETHNKTLNGQPSPTSGVWYNLGNIVVNIPIGEWDAETMAEIQCSASGTSGDISGTLSTANNTQSNADYTFHASGGNGAGTPVVNTNMYKRFGLSLNVATPYYLNIETVAPSVNIYSRGDTNTIIIRAENAYL